MVFNWRLCQWKTFLCSVYVGGNLTMAVGAREWRSNIVPRSHNSVHVPLGANEVTEERSSRNYYKVCSNLSERSEI